MTNLTRIALLTAATLVSHVVFAAPPTTCGGTDDYARALCAYQRRQFVTAEAGFRKLIDAAAEDPVTIKSMYFLARTLMKQGKYEEAAGLLTRIYVTDKPFYDGWNGDFLLGECRRALGKE